MHASSGDLGCDRPSTVDTSCTLMLVIAQGCSRKICQPSRSAMWRCNLSWPTARFSKGTVRQARQPAGVRPHSLVWRTGSGPELAQQVTSYRFKAVVQPFSEKRRATSSDLELDLAIWATRWVEKKIGESWLIDFAPWHVTALACVAHVSCRASHVPGEWPLGSRRQYGGSCSRLTPLIPAWIVEGFIQIPVPLPRVGVV